jgi:hypothetical protein
MAVANHEWMCTPFGVRCRDKENGTWVGYANELDAINSCGNVVPRCDKKWGLGAGIIANNPPMGNWRATSRYRNFDVEFFGGIPNNMGENRFRDFNAVIPATGQQTIIVDESFINPASIVEEAPKAIRKNIIPFTATLAGALLGYYVFDKFFKFSYSNYVGLIAGGAIGYSVSNSKM